MNATRSIPVHGQAPFRFCRALAAALIGFSAGNSTLAQPRIVTPPRNVAVPVSQDAQFRVSATGVAPLTYQWRFHGMPLEGETAHTLLVTNVALAQLGCYDVTVSNSAGAVLSAPAWLLLANRWTELVFFGASDGQPMCATGPPWIDQLASRLGIPLRNYSVAGAGNVALRSQISAYLGSHTPSPNVLFSFWVGGSEDVALGSTERGVSNRLDHVRALAASGARNFLIPRIPPLEFAPKFRATYPNFRNDLARQYDALLDAGLDPLQVEYDLTVFRPDLFAWTTAVWDSPQDYGFHNPPTDDFYCDGFHMKFAAHELVSEVCYRWMTPPVVIARSPKAHDGTLEFMWQGGRPPFRVQQCDDLATGVWRSEDVTFETKVQAPSVASQRFFRVLSLGQ